MVSQLYLKQNTGYRLKFFQSAICFVNIHISTKIMLCNLGVIAAQLLFLNQNIKITIWSFNVFAWDKCEFRVCTYFPQLFYIGKCTLINDFQNIFF